MERDVASVLRRKAKNRHHWLSLQYWLSGGSLLVVVAAILIGPLIFLLINPDRKETEIPVNDSSLIRLIQSQKLATFSAHSVSQFSNITLADVRKTFGRVTWTQAFQTFPLCPTPLELETLPVSFDARSQWPQCFTEPYTSGLCSSSWAIATATALSNRFCIADPENFAGLRLSPQDLLSCDTYDSGCRGGTIDAVLFYIEQFGIVTEKCFPYRGKAPPKVLCSQKCIAETPLYAQSHCRLESIEAIQREIMTNGPVVILILLFDDFLVYESGVYKPLRTAKRLTDSSRHPLSHAVKIIGWGEEKGEPYWLIENNFGHDWGVNGVGKVARNDNYFVIDSVVVAATPKLPKEGEREIEEGQDFLEDALNENDASWAELPTDEQLNDA